MSFFVRKIAFFACFVFFFGMAWKISPAYAVPGTLLIPSTAQSFTTTNIITTKLTLGGVDVTATAAQLNYLVGVTSGIQGQLNAKAPLASPTFTGAVGGITATMVGLGNVNNTSDANKPVSTAQQTALNLKANLASPTFTGIVTTGTQSVTGTINMNNQQITNINAISGYGGPLYFGSSVSFNNYALASNLNFNGYDQALNDGKIYLRSQGDTNHYIWNNTSDWEEIVAYTGTGFKVTGSTGVNMLQIGGSNGYINCFSGYCPTNSAMRLTPNFHINSPAGYAVILNWDNGTTGATQTLRVGNGASSDAFYVRADGYVWASQYGWLHDYFARAGGSNASGTWPINVTGSAGSAGSAGILTGSAHTNGSDGWFRSDGQSGWYNQTYAVGVYATQAGRVDLYNGASLYVPGQINSGGLSVEQLVWNALNTGGNEFYVRGVSTGGGGIGYLQIVAGGYTYGIPIDFSTRTRKSNITNMEVDSSKIYDLRPVSFNANGAPAGTPRGFGLIAEEVNDIIPQLVLRDQDKKIFSINYTSLPVLMLNEMQKTKLASDADLALIKDPTKITISNSSQVTGSNGIIVTKISALAQSFIGKLKAGVIETKKLVVDGVDILKKLNEQQKQIDDLKKIVGELQKIKK